MVRPGQANLMEKFATARSTAAIHVCLAWLFFLLIFSVGTIFAAPPDELQPPHRSDRLDPKLDFIVTGALPNPSGGYDLT